MAENTLANSSILGFIGFGFTMLILSLCNVEFISLSTITLSIVVTFGAILSLIVGIFEMKSNNGFSGITFIVFAFTWLSVAMIWTLPAIGLVGPMDHTSFGFFTLILACFTSCLFIASLKYSKLLQAFFALVSIVFFMLAISEFTRIFTFEKIAGYIGILLGIISFYIAINPIINDDWDNNIFKLK